MKKQASLLLLLVPFAVTCAPAGEDNPPRDAATPSPDGGIRGTGGATTPPIGTGGTGTGSGGSGSGGNALPGTGGGSGSGGSGVPGTGGRGTGGSMSPGTGGRGTGGSMTQGTGGRGTGGATMVGTGGAGTGGAGTGGAGTGGSSGPRMCRFPTPINNGTFTNYWLSQGSATEACGQWRNYRSTACGYVGTSSGSGTDQLQGTDLPTMFAAIPTTEFRNAAVCGACIDLTGPNGRTTIIAADECPSNSNPQWCNKREHLDLSVQARNRIASVAASGPQVSWRYVACPTTGPLRFRVKYGWSTDGACRDSGWRALYVYNNRYEVTRVEVGSGGTWTALTRDRYAFWQTLPGTGPWTVRVTDAAGDVVEATLTNTEMIQNAPTQFPMCTM